ncbi:MAG TPA: glycine cleavage system protein GcvH [Candidatus Acidoferrum sp.]|nr:glycine cleavage system protein GcvH [Candidatus Acidoferrum sp.]
MSAAPKDFYYTAAHAWLQLEDDHNARVGITDFAQSELGDVVHVELPEVTNVVSAGEEVSMVESVKTASDIPTPVSGIIIGVNEALRSTPELINSSPYDKGWIFRIRISNKGELGDLLDAADYLDSCAE